MRPRDAVSRQRRRQAILDTLRTLDGTPATPRDIDDLVGGNPADGAPATRRSSIANDLRWMQRCGWVMPIDRHVGGTLWRITEKGRELRTVPLRDDVAVMYPRPVEHVDPSERLPFPPAAAPSVDLFVAMGDEVRAADAAVAAAITAAADVRARFIRLLREGPA